MIQANFPTILPANLNDLNWRIANLWKPFLDTQNLGYLSSESFYFLNFGLLFHNTRTFTVGANAQAQAKMQLNLEGKCIFGGELMFRLVAEKALEAVANGALKIYWPLVYTSFAQLAATSSAFATYEELISARQFPVLQTITKSERKAAGISITKFCCSSSDSGKPSSYLRDRII